MTFGFAKNGGLSLLVILFLFLASLGYWESSVYRQANKAIALGNNPAHHLAIQQNELIHAAEIAFEIYRRRELILPDDVTLLLDQLNMRAAKLNAADTADKDSTIDGVLNNAKLVRVTWLEIVSIWRNENDLSGDSVHELRSLLTEHLTSLRNSLFTLQIALNATDHSTQLYEIRRLDGMVSLINIEIDKFLHQEAVNLYDIINPIERLLETLTNNTFVSRHDFQDQTQQNITAKQNREARNHTLIFRNALYAIRDAQDDWSGQYFYDYMDEAAGQLKKTERSVRKLGELWVIDASRSSAALEASLEKTANLRTLLSTTGVLIAIVIALGLGRVLGARVRSVTLGTEELASGNLDYRIEVTQQDQLGQLANAFNQMASKLQEKDAEQANYVSALDQSVSEANAANAAKSEFLASMSHEIRTPINGVLGTTDLLSRESLTRTQRHLVDTIQLSGTALLGIINDILDFSKIEAGHMQVSSAPFNMVELLEDVCEMAAPAAHSKGLELSCVIPANTHANVRGDATRLRQVLTNLVSNAIKFTSAGDVTVSVSWEQQANDTQQVRFEVHDTGIGIPASAHESIFSAFSQADRSTTRRYGGTGLGLSISKELVTLMCGEMGVDSATGDGAIFWFSMPLEQETEDWLDIEPAMNGVKSLVVCTNYKTRVALRHRLNSLGVQCVEKVNGQQALSELRGNTNQSDTSYAAIIIDDQLEDMSATSFAKCISDESIATQQIPLVALCRVNEDAQIVQQRKATGISHQLLKPIRQSILYNCFLEIHGLTPNTDTVEMGFLPDSTIEGHILLVEDHPVNQDILTRMLKQLGCGVTLIKNGSIALDLLKQKHFDLVLMDCDMPVMDGFEATRLLRQYEASHVDSKRQHIIALTANALSGDRDRCLAAGMDDYLSKPITLDQLQYMLTHWLQENKEGLNPIRLDPETVVTQQEPTSSDPAVDPSVVDMSIVHQLCAMDEAGNDGFLDQLVNAFSDAWPQDMTNLRQAVGRADGEGIRKAAHRMKSASANLGAIELANLCADVESAGRNHDAATANKMLITLEHAHQNALITLQSVHRKVA